MGKTVRRKNDPKFGWYSGMDDVQYHSDAGTLDLDKNPPKWFKQKQERKYRKRVEQELYTTNDLIDSAYKMPYYT